MTHITLVFPDQLFLRHPCIVHERPVYLVEEFLFYKVQPFHKQRLVLLRSAMRRYAHMLEKKDYKVVYISSKELSNRKSLIDWLGAKGIKNIYLAEFADEWLGQDLKRGAQTYGWHIWYSSSPAFICSEQELADFFVQKERYSMAQFYAFQRKRLNILMEGSSPVGGKYSFDAENRKKLPKGLKIPPVFHPLDSADIDKVVAQVEEEFPDAIGDAVPFLYPTTHEEARQALALFLKNKLALFGDYEDAIDSKEATLFHSVLSAVLNIGLLTPNEVIEAAIHYAKQHPISIHSLEGFIRQVMGWREFVRAAYVFKGSLQRSSNFFKHQDKLPTSFWNGSTGILPVDTVIQRVLKTGYCHHIERLMVLGNFLLLTETCPQEVYKWFMGFFADAYDWVMVPNVYGMSQYADGGMIVTKPYISSSNYILKMSNYPKGEWTDIWDGLFWRFLHKHAALFASNRRTGVLIKMLKRDETKILKKIKKSEEWLKDYKR